MGRLVEDLSRPTIELARVIEAVAQGDLTQQMALRIDGQPVKGAFLRIGKTVNTMVRQLNSFASEVTRVAQEVGTEGKLGGQAEVKRVSGTWRDLTEGTPARVIEPGITPLDDLCRHIIDAMAAEEKGADIAILAARLQAQWSSS